MKKRIIITGATGFIGSQLTELLKDKYDLVLLTRNPDKYTDTEWVHYVYWDGKSVIKEIVEGSYAIINLIGENIGKKRWTDKQKELILNSRRNAAKAVLKSIQTSTNKPDVWIQASATGYYGPYVGEIFDEASPKGKRSFLADVCEEWERPIKQLEDQHIRKVIIRTGVVLARNSDLWKQLNLSFAFGIAAIVGNGKQHLPWIHIEDEANIFVSALENKNWSGIFNAAAPELTTMKSIVSAIKKKRWSLIKLYIPRWLLIILFGKEKTNEIVMTDQKVIPKHLVDVGFTFKYPFIKKAVADLTEKK